MQEMRVGSLGQEDPLEKEMVTHSSILAWKISRTEEPGGLQSMGFQKAGHDLDKTTTTRSLGTLSTSLRKISSFKMALQGMSRHRNWCGCSHHLSTLDYKHSDESVLILTLYFFIEMKTIFKMFIKKWIGPREGVTKPFQICGPQF